jgi:twitching motility protein PilT
MIDSSQIEMSELLQLVVDEGASDLHLEVGVPPVLRLHGRMSSIDATQLKPEDTERFMKSITSEDHQQRIREGGGTDFGFGFGKAARFRVSVLKSKGHVGMVLRQIPSKLMSLDKIGLPSQIKEMLFRPRGLILVTGPTGSGKTTTLACMIDLINMERDGHIITVEDPIEYYHEHKKCVVTQREIGVDVPSFSEALRRALRQDPDVILVGEMRDLETMSAVDAFPMGQQSQVRTQLASGVIAVVSQLLLVRADGPGRVAAFEIMITTPAIQALIRENKTYRITSEIQTGAKWGMITLDAHLMALYQAGRINYEDLITKSQDPESVVLKLEETQRAKKR